MSRVAFEPTIPTFELAKTVHALDRATTVIGTHNNYTQIKHKKIFYEQLIFIFNFNDLTLTVNI
jgi:hypothetical protein